MERCFPPFRLDLRNEQLWREDQPVALRPKTFAVLRYLIERPGQLVTKDALLDVVWAGTVVSDTVLKSCIRELRAALEDDVQTPRFIATAHRRGYRFLPVITSLPQGPGVGGQGSGRGLRHESERLLQLTILTPIPDPQPPAPVLVGRATELLQLCSWWDQALDGERQLVFVTGEAGIGKTTLVDAFLHTLTPSTQPLTPFSWLGRGQCIEQYGAGEPYMPILEALGRLCREPGGERLIALLNQHAPTWLVQMPTLLPATELEAVQRKVQGATRERMLREMTEAIEAITAERPLVLWLEDLHWSDPSTLELLALLARRREAARLLVIGTYRPVEVIVREHPLKAVKQELQLHGQCQELGVRLLSEEAVGAYLAVRWETNGEALPEALRQNLAQAVHQRTEGNPLFMVNVVDEFLTRGKRDDLTVALNTPATIREMIEQQLERLSAEEQRVLEVASVAGVEFSAAAVAAGTETTLDEVEQQCAALARRGQFLQAYGTGPLAPGLSRSSAEEDSRSTKSIPKAVSSSEPRFSETVCWDIPPTS